MENKKKDRDKMTFWKRCMNHKSSVLWSVGILWKKEKTIVDVVVVACGEEK